MRTQKTTDTKLKKLLTPFAISGMRLKNRVVFPAIAIFDSYEDKVNERFKHYFLARARGGAGMMVMTATRLARLEAPIDPAILQRCVDSLRVLIEEIHAEGASVGMQLHHGGREIDEPIPGVEIEPVAASPIPSPVGKSVVPRELLTREIEEIIQRHVHMNAFIKKAGFDFIEVKACHGYLFSGFLSPHTNKRTDIYGGDLKGRARIVLEIIRRTKETLGADLVVGCRFNGSDYIGGGLTQADAPDLGRLLEEAGADYISVSAGVPGSYPTTIPPYYIKEACFAELAASVKKSVKVPVIAVGRITDPFVAEKILQDGIGDLVAIGRGLLAEPELPKKALAGKIDDIRRCISCNQGCFDIPMGESNTCLVNPELGKEQEFAMTPAGKPKRVIVVGGGPAGMEAARSAAARGHEVTLYEKSKQLGGQLRIAALPPNKQDFLEVIHYLKGQLRKLGVKVELGRHVTPSAIKDEKPDAIIIATGSKPSLPERTDIKPGKVITAWDILKGDVHPAKRVLVVGGNSIGLEVANYLAHKGSQVMVAEMDKYFGSNMGRTLRYYLKEELRMNPNIELCKMVKVEQITPENVIVTREGKREVLKGFDTVVWAAGSLSENELTADARNLASEVHVIGDAAEPRDCVAAIREGTEIGRLI